MIVHWIHTSDVHGHLDALQSIENHVNGLREKYGTQCVMLTDGGDSLQGTPQVYYHNYIDTHSPHVVAETIDRMRYDCVAVGNHDIEAGHEVYDRVKGAMQSPFLCANIRHAADGTPYFHPYTIIEKAGMRIAVLSLTTPDTIKWISPSQYEGMEFVGVEESARQWIAYIKEHEHYDMLVGIFPSNFAMPFVDANMLQIIVVALFFATSIIMIGGETGNRLAAGVRLMDTLCVTTLGTIMKLSPVGVFCLMCPTVAANGVAVLGSLAAVICVMYACYAAHLALFDPLFVAIFAGMSPVRFLREMVPAIAFSFSSSSSVGTLPVNLACVHRLGVPDEISSFVLPLGATINMNGTVIYHGVCSVFIAACYGIDLTFGQIVSIVVTSTLASIGTAGVPGAGIVMLSMVLSAAGLPLEGIALVAGVDRIFDMGRTVLNITGDAATAVVIAHGGKNRIRG